MPRFHRGEMRHTYDAADLFLITTNPPGKRNDALAVGRGIARQARDRSCGLDHILGRETAAVRSQQGHYHRLVSPRWPGAKPGTFPAKIHYSGPTSLSIIRRSASTLLAWCAKHPATRVHLNFPGIGNGRLRRGDVLPIVARPADRVAIWEYPKAGHGHNRSHR